MKERMIRLNNKFVLKEESKYYLTNIINVSKWRNINDLDKKKKKIKDVTSKVNKLLKKYKTKSNINIKTKASKKQIKTLRKKMVKGGWSSSKINNNTMVGGWGINKKE